jgi:DNA repair photolyase
MLAVPVRGRATGLNPPNRYESVRLEVLPEARHGAGRRQPRGVGVLTRAYDDSTRRIINRVDSPDLGFKWTLNPYRGCEHGCVYCYARPSHERLGFSCGLDFETRIIAKRDAHRLLRKELAAPDWSGEPIVMSGVTDCYQPMEARLRITRRCLEVLTECRQPVSIVTKNRLLLRDLDLLRALARFRAANVSVSLTTLDPKLAAAMEPRTSRPTDRLRLMQALAGAGIPVAVLLAPIIPGLNDREIPDLLRAAADAGARSAGWIMLRLPHEVKTLFLDWLRRHLPHRADRIERLVRSVRGGKLYEPRFGLRQRGRGPLADQIEQTFRVFSIRCGLDRPAPALSPNAFRRPRSNGQLTLFEGEGLAMSD